MTVAECSDELNFSSFSSVVGFHTVPGQHGQLTLTSFGEGYMHVCLDVTCHLVLAEWPRSFMCRRGNMGWNGHQIRSEQKDNSGEENSPAPSPGT